MGTQRRFAFGVGATLTSEAVGRIAALGFQFLAATSLGPHAFGMVSLALASAAILSPLADLGLQNVAMQSLANNSTTSSPGRVLGFKLLLLPLFLLPLLGWSLLSDHATRSNLFFAGLFYVTLSFGDVLRQCFRANQRSGSELLARLWYPVGSLIGLGLLWKFHLGPSHVLAASLIGPLLMASAYVILLPSGSRKPDISLQTLLWGWSKRPIILQSLFYLGVVGFSSRVDAFLLEDYAGTAEVGRYFVTLNFVMAGAFFAQGLASYLFPYLHRHTSHPKRTFFRCVAIQASLGVALALGAGLVGPMIFRLAFGNSSYSGCEKLLPVMGAMLFFITMDWLWFNILMGKNRTWIAAINLLPLLAIKLLVAPAWIEANGAAGMAKAALIGGIITSLLGFLAAWKVHFGPPTDSRQSLKPDI